MITVNAPERASVMDLVRVIELNELHEDPDRFAVWVWLTASHEVRELSEAELVEKLTELAEQEQDQFIGDYKSGAEFAYEYLVEINGVVIPEEIDVFVDWERVWDHSLSYDFNYEQVWDRADELHFYIWYTV